MPPRIDLNCDLWEGAGHDAEQVVDVLVSFSRYAVPQPLLSC